MAHISQTGNRLNELFHEIGCTDKHTTHSYGYFYGPFLEHKRTTAKNVLEIGVSSFGGGCLEAFALFFENANVYGIDISPCDRANRNVYPKNVTFIIGDAYHPNGPLQLLDDIQWDVVIERDGVSLTSRILQKS
jgi:methylase of polypeptide subunit release factors